MSGRHYRFRQEAMATVFEVTIAQDDVDPTYAGQAADAVFAEIARLEDELSRFRQTSDIWRISQLTAGESLSVGLAAWDCLSLAKAVHASTHGAFDITIGPLMQVWRNADGTPRQPAAEELELVRTRIGSHLFELDPDGFLVRVLADHMVFDLGALGKGYALDQAVDVLRDWSIGNALLNAGDSSVLAIGAPPGDTGWVVTFTTDERHTLSLRDRALSGSGFAVKGGHIMNPRTFAPVPVRADRIYASAPTASLSDALSTAFMVMDRAEIDRLCAAHPGVEAMLVP